MELPSTAPTRARTQAKCSPHKGKARQASALSYQSSSFDSKIVRGRFRRAADSGVKKITKIGRLATGRGVGRMGVGTGHDFTDLLPPEVFCPISIW